MKIEIDTKEKKIYLLESTILKDLYDELYDLGIDMSKSDYTIEVKSPIVVQPWHIPPTQPWITPSDPWIVPTQPYKPYEVWCSSNTAKANVN